MLLISTLLLLIIVPMALVYWEVRKKNLMQWLGSYLKQDWRSSVPVVGPRHVMFCFVDHYEPQWLKPSYDVEVSRVARWRQDYPKLCSGHRDADGRAPVHSFFYPEEEYRPEHMNALVELCQMGLGEIDIHLHHDKDTEAGLREKLQRFTQLLVRDHGALPVSASGQPLWSFIHGNWALDNCHPTGFGCGVNNELKVLADEGCYADFTLPAAPDPCQTSTINKIYYAIDDPHRPKSHDSGVRVSVGGKPVGDLMIIQGPLGFMFKNRKLGLLPRIENADVRTSCPPTPDRVDAWVDMGIHVEGRPEWIFVKVHTHGTQERDIDTLLGAPMDKAFSYLESKYNDGVNWQLHYVSARETYNIIKAAEAGLEGNPGQYRDFVIPRPSFVPQSGS
jgi:hypothetical protein